MAAAVNALILVGMPEVPECLELAQASFLVPRRSFVSCAQATHASFEAEAGFLGIFAGSVADLLLQIVLQVRRRNVYVAWAPGKDTYFLKLEWMLHDFAILLFSGVARFHQEV